jgi:single-strand DNA-binding protein
MLNQFTLIGRVARDPQLQTTRDGISFTRFTLAVRRSFKNQQGQYDTDFIQLISWNKMAERVADYCTKGSLISVNGRLQMRTVEHEQQKRMTIPDIVAENVTFLQMKRADQQQSVNQVHIPPAPQPSPQTADRSSESNQPEHQPPASASVLPDGTQPADPQVHTNLHTAAAAQTPST